MGLSISRRKKPCCTTPPRTASEVGDWASGCFAEGETGSKVHTIAHVTVRDIGCALTSAHPGERQRCRDDPRSEAGSELGIGRQGDRCERRGTGKGRVEIQVHELRTRMR